VSVLRAVLASLIVLSPAIARADQLEEVKKRGTLIWGADQEGGGPYVYPDEHNPEVVRGFEVEIADQLARELGVKAELKQAQWNQLPSLLGRGEIDVALNGFELTSERAPNLVSRPYYAYGLQLLVRDSSAIQSWSDFRAVPGRAPPRIGALGGSAAAAYLQKNYAGEIEVVSYDGATDVLQHVESGVLDGGLQDDCVTIFYAGAFPRLRFVEKPVGAGYYVALVAPGQATLRDAVDRALEKMLADGSLEAIYDHYHLGGRAQMLALRHVVEVQQDKPRRFDEVIASSAGVLLKSAGMTVLLALASMPLAILIGLFVALGRVYAPPPIGKLLGLYVEVLRGTPLMLQLYAIFFLLPQLGLKVPAMVAAIAGLAINYSAYEAEIYRAGLQAIPVGQMEAALSLGMSKSLALRRILVPQAIRIVIPPVTNDFIALFKDTSVCSVVTVVELTKRYNVLAMSNPAAIVELAALTAALYLLMSYPMSLLARWSEQRLSSG
jgi:polar amino acid transport system substrate-binding protein